MAFEAGAFGLLLLEDESQRLTAQIQGYFICPTHAQNDPPLQTGLGISEMSKSVLWLVLYHKQYLS